MKFSDNFWEGNGFNDVITHVKSNKTLEFIGNYFSERAAIELEFSKQLQKLSKKFDGINEIGTIQSLLNNLKSEIDKESQLRLKFSTELKSLSSDVSSNSKEIKKQQKLNFTEFDKLHKEFKSLTSKVSSSQAKYFKICADNAQLETKMQDADPKAKSKLSQSLAKGQKSQGSAEQEYQTSIQKQNAFLPQYIEKATSIFDSIQENERKNKDYLKATLTNYNSSMKNMDSYISEAVSNINKSLDSANPNGDIDLWISQNQTGSKRPQMAQFIPYGSSLMTESSNEFTITRTDSNLSSRNSLSNSSSSYKEPSTSSITLPKSYGKEEYSESYQQEYQEEYGEEYQEEYGEEYQEEYGEEYQEEYGEEYQEEYSEYVVALWDYSATESNEISFKAGEVIYVTSKEDEGWWVGQNENGDVGLFPVNYTSPPEQ